VATARSGNIGSGQNSFTPSRFERRRGLIFSLCLLLAGCSVDLASTTTTLAISTTTSTQSVSSTSPALPDTTTTSAVTTTTEPAKGWLVIQAVGDVNLDGDVIPNLRQNGYEFAWSGLDGLFVEDDLSVINLECSPSPDGPKEAKEFVFGCDTEAYPAMVDAGIEVANLGNNHSQDHGKPAMLAGRQLLIDAGLSPVGAGKDEDEAGSPAIFEINGWKVAVVGFGGVFPHPGWFATPDRPGMRDGDTIETMVEAVESAAELADIVVVIIHWGVELDTQPRPEDRERAEAMIAAGADMIFGHHPHRLQPLEMVSGRPVAWSLGNFVWPNLSTAGSTTAVARVVVSPEGEIKACLIPAFIESAGHPVLRGEPECGPG
jgi:Bacterial capsule synthesis protein PGA_cap